MGVVHLAQSADATVFTGLFYRDEIAAYYQVPDAYRARALREFRVSVENLIALGADEVTDDVTRQTLSVLLKYERDIDTALAELQIAG